MKLPDNVFAAMLALRFKEWARIRRNLLARRRYALAKGGVK